MHRSLDEGLGLLVCKTNACKTQYKRQIMQQQADRVAGFCQMHMFLCRVYVQWITGFAIKVSVLYSHSVANCVARRTHVHTRYSVSQGLKFDFSIVTQLGYGYCVLASVQLCYNICVLFANHGFGEKKAQRIFFSLKSSDRWKPVIKVCVISKGMCIDK